MIHVRNEGRTQFSIGKIIFHVNELMSRNASVLRDCKKVFSIANQKPGFEERTWRSEANLDGISSGSPNLY